MTGGVIAQAPAGATTPSYNPPPTPVGHQSVVVTNTQQDLKPPSVHRDYDYPAVTHHNHHHHSFANFPEGGAVSADYGPFGPTASHMYSPTAGSEGSGPPFMWPGSYSLSPSWPYGFSPSELDPYLHPAGGTPLTDLLPPISYATDTMPRTHHHHAQGAMMIAGYGGANYMVTPAKKRTGGRRPKEEEEALGPEETEKRKLRRIRNKEAAARCRQRRLDHMNQLQNQVDALVAENQLKEDEIESLRQEKAELEHLLHSHNCVMMKNSLNGDATPFLNPPTPVKIFKKHQMKPPQARPVKLEPCDPILTEVNPMESDLGIITSTAGLMRPETLPVGFETPNTPGVPISTPSAGLNFDFLGQPTGLTPITNSGLTPILTLGGLVTTSGGMVLETPTGMDTSGASPVKISTTLCNL